MSQEDRYRAAGVDIEKADQFIKNIGDLVKSTHTKGVVGGLGGFSGLYSLAGMASAEPVLVSSTDGVGTKLKIAFLTGRHDTIGIDMVAMVVNDIVVTGAKPLFLLDYLATGKLELGVAEAVIAGVVNGCRQADCALIGGETAEMPGMYPPGEYDLAGFAVGLADRAAIIDGSRVAPGAAVVGLASSGLHSNGFSLVRKIVFEELGLTVDDQPAGLEAPVGETLLTPTKIYVKPVLAIKNEFDLLAAAHITGGGLAGKPASGAAPGLPGGDRTGLLAGAPGVLLAAGGGQAESAGDEPHLQLGSGHGPGGARRPGRGGYIPPDRDGRGGLHGGRDQAARWR